MTRIDVLKILSTFFFALFGTAAFASQTYSFHIDKEGDYFLYYKVGKDSTFPLNFRVICPTGDDSLALESYLDAQSTMTFDNYHTFSKQEKPKVALAAVKKLQAFADRYPMSVYKNDAIYIALTVAFYRLEDRVLFYILFQRAINEYPIAAVLGFDFLKSYYFQHKADFLGYREELKNIIQKDVHPKLTAKAKKELNTVKREIRKRNIKALR